MHPHRLHSAHRRGDLDFYDVGIVSFFIDEIATPLCPEQEVSYTLAALSDAMGWPLGPEALRQRLHRLRRWIEFDVGPGQRRPWTFRLTGAAIDADLQPTSNETPPSRLEVTSNDPDDEEAAMPLPEHDSDPARLPTARAPREELSRDERTPAVKDDQLLGKTTASESEEPEATRRSSPEESDRFLEKVEATNGRRDPDDLHATIERARSRQPESLDSIVQRARAGQQVDVDSVWPGPAVEGEEGVLADAQALVDAGLAGWS
jgi:hypothetical protein